jgi:hypothetical protein
MFDIWNSRCIEKGGWCWQQGYVDDDFLLVSVAWAWGLVLIASVAAFLSLLPSCMLTVYKCIQTPQIREVVLY